MEDFFYKYTSEEVARTYADDILLVPAATVPPIADDNAASRSSHDMCFVISMYHAVPWLRASFSQSRISMKYQVDFKKKIKMKYFSDIMSFVIAMITKKIA